MFPNMVSPYSLVVLSYSGATVNAYKTHRYNTKVLFGAFITSKAIEIIVHKVNIKYD